MNVEKFSKAMSELDSQYVDEALTYRKRAKRPGRFQWGAIAACLVVVIASGTVAFAASKGYNLLEWIKAALTQSGYSTDSAVVQGQLDEGQWVYLNEGYIAVILPGSPTKILLSDDSGQTWRESVVEGSDKMFLYGEMREGVAPIGGFIGFFEGGGYLVLTMPASMGNQPIQIYITGDGGDTWSEIGNPYDANEHFCVLTGAGFSTEKIGFISYRYYEDAGPDIWWTSDGGETWEKLEVAVPEEYSGCVFTPKSPVFEGASGIYPIEVQGQSDQTTIYMYSDDYGMTWQFR